MDKVLYYSNLCVHSKNTISTITKQNLGNNLSFICIDNRTKDGDGKIYVTLENGNKILLPEHIQKVPALMFLNKNFQVVYGSEICTKLKESQTSAGPGPHPQHGTHIQNQPASKNAPEPTGFSFGGGGGDIMSDTFSFWDSSSDDLETKGNAGLRQIHHYSTVDGSNCPVTQQTNSDTTYKPNKVSDSEYAAFENNRNNVKYN